MKQKIAILLIAGFSLLAWTSCNNSKPSDNNNTTSETFPKIAVLDIDSMQNALDFYKTKLEEFSKEQESIQNELTGLQRNIINTANNLQKRIENKDISDVDIAATQKKLENMQINLQKRQETLSMKLFEKQQEFNATLTAMMEQFTKEYNAQAGYDLIIVKSTTAFANPQLDITADFTPKFNEWINKKLKDEAAMKTFMELGKQKNENKTADSTKNN